LSAGEELRPTGSDRGLLRQVTRVTGGKVRDTLAGIFSDRDALRFAYQDLSRWLVVLCAGGLLLGVASRRLAMPDIAIAASSAVVGWFSSLRKRKRGSTRAAKPASPPSLEALRQAKARSEVTRPAPTATSTETPHFARPSEPPPLPAVPPPLGERETLRTSAPPSAGRSHRPPARTATAAEILLSRRRGRKP
ncbi:MAG TPA: hypothetical protein VHM25_24060, partial [Polyangiaceae bacterium]|nr:hypothetical protein [Polyangiaceae bacterium]